jgi:hypothetical protein
MVSFWRQSRHAEGVCGQAVSSRAMRPSPVLGGMLVAGHNLELFGGLLHSDVGSPRPGAPS